MAEHPVTAQPNRHKRSGNSLNGTETAITDPQFAQCWTLDETGNWKNFRQDDNGDDTWNLNQTRTANGVNEITGITASTGPVWAEPVYNKNGNMTSIPRTPAPNPDWANFTADQWTSFTPDQWSNLEERIGTFTTPAEHHIWGVQYIDNLICRDRSTTGTLNERLYAMQDANWNVTGIVSASGSVAERYEYDPCGNTLLARLHRS